MRASALRPIGQRGSRIPVPPSYQIDFSSGRLSTFDDPPLMLALARLEFGDQMLAEHMRVSADIFHAGSEAQVALRLGSSGVLTGDANVPRRFASADYFATVARPDVYASTERMTIVSRNVLFGLRQLDAAMTAVIEALSDEATP